MEFSDRIADMLFDLQYRVELGSQSEASTLVSNFDNFAAQLSLLLTHYQTNLNATLSDDHIRAILYFYHIHNFLTRPEFEEELVLADITLFSIAERFVSEKLIKIMPETDTESVLQLNKSFHIFAGNDILTVEFLKGLDKVTLPASFGLLLRRPTRPAHRVVHLEAQRTGQ